VFQVILTSFLTSDFFCGQVSVIAIYSHFCNEKKIARELPPFEVISKDDLLLLQTLFQKKKKALIS